jgi:hypothetical protein
VRHVQHLTTRFGRFLSIFLLAASCAPSTSVPTNRTVATPPQAENADGACTVDSVLRQYSCRLYTASGRLYLLTLYVGESRAELRVK